MKEKDIQRAILTHYKEDPRVLCWRNNTGSGFSQDGTRRFNMGMPGSPDIIMVHNGRFIGIEVKSSGKTTLRPTQALFKARCESVGALYIVVNDYDKAVVVIEEVLNGCNGA